MKFHQWLKMISPSDYNREFLAAQAEIASNHDKMMLEFANRDREHQAWRKQVDYVAKQSMYCYELVAELYRMNYLSYEVFKEFMVTNEWTAYLPIEVGSILRNLKEEETFRIMIILFKTRCI